MQPAAAAIASEAVAFQVIISFTDSIIGFFFFFLYLVSWNLSGF